MEENSSFEKAVLSQGKQTLVRDFVYFLKNGKKWWLLPFILIFFGVGLLVLLAGTGAAPFIYTFF